MTTSLRLRRSDAGQATPLMVLLLLVMALTVLVLVETAQLLDASAQARTAADAAALAGAAAGHSSASEIASANGGVLLDYSEQPLSAEQPRSMTTDDVDEVVLVTVEVQVGSATQTARAERRVAWTSPQVTTPLGS